MYDAPTDGSAPPPPLETSELNEELIRYANEIGVPVPPPPAKLAKRTPLSASAFVVPTQLGCEVSAMAEGWRAVIATVDDFAKSLEEHDKQDTTLSGAYRSVLDALRGVTARAAVGITGAPATEPHSAALFSILEDGRLNPGKVIRPALHSPKSQFSHLKPMSPPRERAHSPTPPPPQGPTAEAHLHPSQKGFQPRHVLEPALCAGWVVRNV